MPNGRSRSAALVLILIAATSTTIGDVTGEQVKRAIAAGVKAIKERQLPDGSWVERYYPGGETCLATLALLQAGESVTSKSIVTALNRIRDLPDDMVYVVGLKAMVLAAADSTKYRREIEQAAAWLAEAQNKTGLWTYRPGMDTFDHSNTQFALLGLNAAATAGARVAPALWARARTTLLENQNRDGGWSYQKNGGSYGSMTAAGVSDLLILGSVEQVSREKHFHNGAAPGCGKYQANKPLNRGLDWIAQNFRADTNPARDATYTYYWLYAVERCGILSGNSAFGRHDWYRLGAEFLVRSQTRSGMWTTELPNTCFGVLFLAKGHKALLVQKLKWSSDEAWNPDRDDLDHLVAFIGDKLGEPVAWQAIPFDAPLEDWLAAPVLYVQGHDFPSWRPPQRAKVRQFIERGGVLLAEACCGRTEFKAGFRKFAAETFPESPPHRLGPEHAAYNALFQLKPGTLEGIDLGCRTSIFFSPDDLSCLWEQGDVPALSEEAFKLGANIAAYATGRQKLRDRLDVVKLPKVDEQAQLPGPAPFDATRLAQVVYNGDWRTDPLALVRQAEFMRDQAGLDVITQYREVRLTDADLYTCPILYLTGHFKFDLTEPELAALRNHLRRGGFLIADACCGRDDFDRSFRGRVEKCFPASHLEVLPPDHPIFRGEPGFRLEAVTYRPSVLRENPELKQPKLWGLAVDGRLALVYSPFALGCGMDGHECSDCRGLMPDDARRLTTNIVLYALNH